MSDLELRDHSQPCEHGPGPLHKTGHWLDDGWCPGGKKIVMRKQQMAVAGLSGAWYPTDSAANTDFYVWVEVSDE